MSQNNKIKAKQHFFLDGLLTHKIWGVFIFFIFFWLVFELTFGIGHYPMKWIESFVFLLEDTLQKFIPDGMIKSLLVNGILKGVGGVIIFLPNIVILFFSIVLVAICIFKKGDEGENKYGLPSELQ